MAVDNGNIVYQNQKIKNTKLAPINTKACKSNIYRLIRREEGIRTLDTVTRILPFQGSSFNHSDTSLFICWQR